MADPTDDLHAESGWALLITYTFFPGAAPYRALWHFSHSKSEVWDKAVEIAAWLARRGGKPTPTRSQVQAEHRRRGSRMIRAKVVPVNPEDYANG